MQTHIHSKIASCIASPFGELVLGNGSIWETITFFARLSVSNLLYASVLLFNSVCSYFCALIFMYLCNVTRVSILSGTKVRELP